MVEWSQTAGRWPNLYESLRSMGEKLAEWFAPSSDALAFDDTYEVNVELPEVTAADVDVLIHDNGLVVRGEKRFGCSETRRTYFIHRAGVRRPPALLPPASGG